MEMTGKQPHALISNNHKLRKYQTCAELQKKHLLMQFDLHPTFSSIINNKS